MGTLRVPAHTNATYSWDGMHFIGGNYRLVSERFCLAGINRTGKAIYYGSHTKSGTYRAGHRASQSLPACLVFPQRLADINPKNARIVSSAIKRTKHAINLDAQSCRFYRRKRDVKSNGFDFLLIGKG